MMARWAAGGYHPAARRPTPKRSPAAHPWTILGAVKELLPALVRHVAAFVVLLLIAAACSGTVPPVLPAPVATASDAAPPEKPPCELATELRARVPRLMKEGKLHRTGRVIQKANRLCPATAKETWAAEVEVAEALGTPGKYEEAKRLIEAIGAASDAPEAA